MVPYSARSLALWPAREFPRCRQAAVYSALLVCCWSFAITAEARIYVDTNSPAVPAGSGSSWSDAIATVQEGINQASQGEEIWVADGVYSESVTLDSAIDLYGGFEGYGGAEETSLGQRDWEANVTVIDASLANGGGPALWCVRANGVSATTLDGFTIRGAADNASGGGGLYYTSTGADNVVANCLVTANTSVANGGGVHLYQSDIEMVNCDITANTAAHSGAGVYSLNGGLTLTACEVSHNTIASGYGGGLYCDGTVGTFAGCDITSNTAPTGGAGLYCDNDASLSISGGTIAGNVTPEGYGGAAYVSGSSLVLSDCAVTSNSARWEAGGLRGVAGASLDLTDCEISQNVVRQGDGGGVNVNDDSSLTMTGCHAARNVANNGAGVDAPAGSMVTRSRFTANTAGGSGGGLRGRGLSIIMNCVFAGNQASEGGALSNTGGSFIVNCTFAGNQRALAIETGSHPTITNSIFDGNTGYAIREIFNGSNSTLSFSLFGSNPDGDYIEYVDFFGPTTYTGADQINANVDFAHSNLEGDLKFHDAPAQDFQLTTGSAAIDRGTSITVPLEDIEGQPRPFDFLGVGYDGPGAAFDIGAHEYQPAFAPTSPSARDIDLGSITWTWQDNADDEDGFRIYSGPGPVAPDGGAITLPADTTDYTTNSLDVNTQHAFQIEAFNTVGVSARTVNYTTWTAIQPVAGLTLQALDSSSIRATPTSTPDNLALGLSGLRTSNAMAGTNSGWRQDSSAWVSGGLTPNTSYDFYATSRNGGAMETTPTSSTTHSLAPSAVLDQNIACDQTTATWRQIGTVFSFTNPAGFGTSTHGGNVYRVSAYRVVFNTSPTHSFTGAEPQWNSGAYDQTASAGGSYFIHLQSLNANGVANPATIHWGPYNVEGDAPVSEITAPTSGTVMADVLIPLEWTTSDVGPSGIASVDVYCFDGVSTSLVPGSPFAPGTTSAVYRATGDGDYAFWTIAHDNAGNSELAPAAGYDVIVTVDLPKNQTLFVY